MKRQEAVSVYKLTKLIPKSGAKCNSAWNCGCGGDNSDCICEIGR